MAASSATHPWADCRNLIILAGHAIFTGGRYCDTSTAADDSNWVLQSFQSGEGKYYLQHLERAIHLCSEDPHSLLILSGGQTRSGSHLTEAGSYFDAAFAHDFFGIPSVISRITTEDYARDSYENILFSLARFYECTSGKFPEKIVLISWKFKRPRLLHHAHTIRWPTDKLVYEGVGDPDDLEGAIRAGERTLKAFEKDPSGNGEELGAKKAERNPYNRNHPYTISCPLMSDVLAWKGMGRVPVDSIPWETVPIKDGYI